ncbi:N-acetylglucosamine-6-phosphate deacetylase [Nakamurella panacisegetis]|uniref:N-acetylglucosamine-6-phosphate deacetylase n=1 Tax=Nakamurella panacisegetis TaxID=1090615 RepID=A0A1H0QRS1_9ACTN|nr:amidohydrolase family protein [Nakamurella panacisegetis]SDP19880.1 N-acetylglucosamine-6-phosphate deacetylase [Nakamurella panacisegetis]
MSSTAQISGRDPSSGRRLEVTVTDGRIAAVRHGPATDGPYLSAGLVDLQVNGFGGLDVNAADLTVDQVHRLGRLMFAAGVTTWLPTLITADHERTAAGLRVIAQARSQDPLTRHSVPYVHLEGPHLSDQDGPRGVHDARFIRPPSLEEFDDWQAGAGDLIGMVTLSPHYPQAADYTRALVDRGVHVAIGHTHATPDQIRRVVDAGATLSTHLGNGAHAVLPRHPNYLWTQLAEDRLTAGFIADGHHLPADTLRVMLRAKGIGGSVLVSDAVALAGVAPGRYRTPVGGDVILDAEGRLTSVDTGFLAGAARGLLDDLGSAIRMADLTLAQVLQLGSTNPGRFVGRSGLREGEPADLIRFDHRPGEGLRLRQTWVGGELMFGRVEADR